MNEEGFPSMNEFIAANRIGKGQCTRGSVMFTDGSCSNYQDKIASSVIEPERALYHIPQNFKEAYYAG